MQQGLISQQNFSKVRRMSHKIGTTTTTGTTTIPSGPMAVRIKTATNGAIMAKTHLWYANFVKRKDTRETVIQLSICWAYLCHPKPT